MQDNFSRNNNIEDILSQIRDKKSPSTDPRPNNAGTSFDSRSSYPARKPVFTPNYEENTDIAFTTTPAVELAQRRPKPKGPVFGAPQRQRGAEIPIPPPASNKGHGVVTGLLDSIDRPGQQRPTVQPASTANYPRTSAAYPLPPKPTLPQKNEQDYIIERTAAPDLQKPPQNIEMRSVPTPQPREQKPPAPSIPPVQQPIAFEQKQEASSQKSIPYAGYSPYSTSDTLLPDLENTSPREEKMPQQRAKIDSSTADTLLSVAENSVEQEAMPVATPVVSETFTTPKKRRRTAEMPKERVITKEVVKPTFKSLRELEQDINEMESRPNVDASSQEFGTGEMKQGTGSIRVESFGDERFFEFFSETVAMDKTAMRAAAKGQKKKKSSRNYFNTESINTGDIPISESFVTPGSEEAEVPFEQDIEEPIEVDDYNNLSDAAGILHDLKSMTRLAFVRFFIMALLTVGVTYFVTALTFVMPLPSIFTGESGDSFIYYGAISLMVVGIVVAFPTFGRGFTGLFSIPTQDSFVFLSMLGAISQLLVMVLTGTSAISSSITIFAPVAMLTYAVNALGRWVQMRGISNNFSLATEGFDHSAAFLVRNRESVLKLTAGIQEEYPELMLSRPTALVKNFLRQSFSPHESDKNGKRFGLALFFTSVAAAAITFYLSSGDLAVIASVFAAVLVIAAPLGAIFVQVLPTVLMNQSAARVGAIIPGWEAIEGIGKTTAVMLGAHDIFPPSTVRLHGIKTFSKEQRIDLAILYAASILTRGCDTLRDIFLSMIEGKTEMLYETESLTNEIGYGFTAWVDGKRVNIGNRELMERNDIALPSIDLENRFSKSERSVIYLAVSGKLYCMFLVSYVADEDISTTLNILRQSGVSILVRSDDFNITRELVSQKFQIAPENVKVLNGKEEEIASRYTNYLPESEGLMTHVGSFASFIGGLRAASAADSAERMATLLEAFTVILSMVITVVLAVTSGLHGLSITIVMLYQVVWMLITIFAILIKRY